MADPPPARPLVDVLAEFFGTVVADDITRRINAHSHAVYTEWHSRPNRDAYVHQAIREAAYRAVHDILAQDYVTVREDIPDRGEAAVTAGQFVIGRLGHTPQEVADGAAQYCEYWNGEEWIHARDRALMLDDLAGCADTAVFEAEPDQEQRVAHGVFIERIETPGE